MAGAVETDRSRHLLNSADVLRSVDLWIKGCVKSCTFLLRRRPHFPSPSCASHAQFYPEIPPPHYNEMGWEAIERMRFLASLPLAGTGQREGGKKMQPFNRFQSGLGRFCGQRGGRASKIAKLCGRHIWKPLMYFTPPAARSEKPKCQT